MALETRYKYLLPRTPWYKIDPCQRLKKFAESYEGVGIEPFIETHRRIEITERRAVQLPTDLAMHRDGTVMVNVRQYHPELAQQLGCGRQPDGRPKIKQSSVDTIILPKGTDPAPFQEIHEAGMGGLINAEELVDLSHYERTSRFVAGTPQKVLVLIVGDQPETSYAAIEKANPSVILLRPSRDRIHGPRRLFEWLQNRQLKIPVILNFTYDCSPEDLVIRASNRERSSSLRRFRGWSMP